MENYKQLIKDAFAAVIENPEYDETLVSRYFSPDYIQEVDGKRLHFEQFKQHIQVLKQSTSSVVIHFTTMVQENHIVFTNHIASAITREGRAGEAHVIAEFRIRNKKIYYCSELTRLINGNPEDGDLGSRH